MQCCSICKLPYIELVSITLLEIATPGIGLVAGARPTCWVTSCLKIARAWAPRQFSRYYAASSFQGAPTRLSLQLR